MAKTKKSPVLSIFLLEHHDYCGFPSIDEINHLIVVAKDEAQARKLAKNAALKEAMNYRGYSGEKQLLINRWLNESSTECLGVANPGASPEVVLTIYKSR